MFTRLLSLWMTGALLLPLSFGVESDSEDDDYDVTPSPNYDYDYNSTFDYYFYNASSPPTINYGLYEVLHDVGSRRNKMLLM